MTSAGENFHKQFVFFNKLPRSSRALKQLGMTKLKVIDFDRFEYQSLPNRSQEGSHMAYKNIPEGYGNNRKELNFSIVRWPLTPLFKLS